MLAVVGVGPGGLRHSVAPSWAPWAGRCATRRRYTRRPRTCGRSACGGYAPRPVLQRSEACAIRPGASSHVTTSLVILTIRYSFAKDGRGEEYRIVKITKEVVT